MRIALPFTPPNDRACMALYHPERNAWWLAMGTHNDEGLPDWKKAIQLSKGTLIKDLNVDGIVARNSWEHLQADARALLGQGFVCASGGIKEISSQGTRWLRANPTQWWLMKSASVEQLQLVASLPTGGELVLGALARQGRFGQSTGRRGLCGPSIVEHRWRATLPSIMNFADQCEQLGLTASDSLALWKSTHLQTAIHDETIDMGALLDLK